MRSLGADPGQFRDILERLPAIVWVTDPTHDLVFLNQSAANFYGDNSSAALGLPWLDLVHREDRVRLAAVVTSPMDPQSKHTLIFRTKGQDEIWCWMEACIQPLFNDHGSFDGLFYMARDLGGIGEHGSTNPEKGWMVPPPSGLQDELRAAIENDELLLYFQPKLEMPDFLLLGFEALVRWPHPTHGLLQPVSFIQLAEDFDLIRPLTNWVFRETARHIKIWIDSGYIPLPVAVNVSPGEFLTALTDHHLPAYLAFDLPPGLLELEITEGAMLADVAEASSVVNRLHQLGIKVAIDDFGTGYSSLARLNSLPISTLKIDRVLTKDVHWNSGSRAVTSGIIAIARDLGIDVIAEGVENHAQLKALSGMDCNVVQGFLTGHPMPGDEAMTLLTQATAKH